MAKSNDIRFDTMSDKKTVTSRTGRATTVGSVATTSALWTANAGLKDSGSKLVQAGLDLATAEAQVEAATSQLAALKTARDGKMVTYDTAYDLYVANGEAAAKTPEDAQTLGLVLAGARMSHPLVPPNGIKAAFDTKKNELVIQLDRAAGLNAYIIETCPDPIATATWTRVPGTGSKRRVPGYKPGGYWVRAASVKGQAESAFAEAVFVQVR